jgi:hypothetical protein
MIEAYLRELGGRLPLLRRRRFLAEAEAHLRDAAGRHEREGLPPADAERRAVEEFGPADVVAARLAVEAAAPAGRLAALLVLAAAVLFVVPLYGIPENTLPPAPWAEVPGALVWKRDLSAALWLAAVALASIGLARRLLEASAAALACLAASAVLGAVLAIEWDAEAPATPLARLLAQTVPLAATAVLVPAATLLYARRLARG